MTATIPLTFIIPSYGRQKKLERAVGSILSQAVQPEEIVIIDDASPEPLTLPKAAMASAGHVRIIRHAVNGGAAQGRNTGLQAARTDWVSFLDSDDWLLPDTLYRRWQFLQEEESRSAAQGRTVYGCGWQDTLPDGTVLRERIPLPAQGAADFFRGCWFSPGSCIMLNRREVLNRTGGADGSLRRLEDYEWFVRIGLAGFDLKVQDMAGVGIERGSNTSLAAVTAATTLIRLRIQDLTQARPDREGLLRKADAYLLYERAASAWREKRFAAFALLMAASLLASPRLQLSPMPGWRARITPPVLSPSP
jgi:glycosyltransferase involved in cell wall biosynthesis